MLGQESGASAVSGAFLALAVGCGTVVGIADAAGQLLAQAVYGNEDEPDRDVRVSFTGRALEREANCNSSAAKSPATQPVSSSPAQGILTPILITGSPGVGKTTLAKAFVTGSIPEAVKPTVGADLLFKTMHLGKHKAYVQIWETQLLSSEQHSLENKCRQATYGSIMVYSTKEPHSLQELKAWHSTLKSKASKEPNTRMAVLGNAFLAEQEDKKADGTVISNMLSEVEAYCTEHGLSHFLMSTEDDVKTVQAAFKQVIDSSMQISLRKRREAALASAPPSPARSTV